jgi:hypothetical protein
MVNTPFTEGTGLRGDRLSFAIVPAPRSGCVTRLARLGLHHCGAAAATDGVGRPRGSPVRPNYQDGQLFTAHWRPIRVSWVRAAFFAE